MTQGIHTRHGIYRKLGMSLAHVFIPHSRNSYHPHLIRPIGLALIVLFAVLTFAWAAMPNAESVKGSATSFTKKTLLDESNKVRKSNNLSNLVLDDSLNSAAGLKARDMLVRQYWDHTAPDGTTPWYWFREVNYRYDYAGENLAKGFDTSAGVVTAWMNSEEHKKNALGEEYQDVGFGIAEGELNGERTIIVVAMYGSTVGSPDLMTPEVLAANQGSITPIARLGIGMQSLNATALGSLGLLTAAMVVAIIAHGYRKHLPPKMRKSWRRHHGLYKSLGMASLILLLLTLYGGGEIL